MPCRPTNVTPDVAQRRSGAQSTHPHGAPSSRGAAILAPARGFPLVAGGANGPRVAGLSPLPGVTPEREAGEGGMRRHWWFPPVSARALPCVLVGNSGCNFKNYSSLRRNCPSDIGKICFRSLDQNIAGMRTYLWI